MHRTETSAVRNVVSELQTLLHHGYITYLHGTLVRLVHTFKQRTKVPYLHKKRVPYMLTVLLS